VGATGTAAVADSGSPPRVLIAASTWWPSSARLAIALARCGCAVSAFCPQGHPLRYLGAIRRAYKIRGFASLASLFAAIQDAKPDLIVPCDDRIVAQLHELFRQHPGLRPLIEQSLGNPENFDITDSREKLLQVATELRIRVPRGSLLVTEADAERQFAEFAPVAVIKLDGTHGGEGVRIVRSAKEAAAAFRSLQRSLGIISAAHRLIIHGDPLAMWSWIKRATAAITIQEYIPGTPANNMVACWKGEILGHVSMEAVSWQGLTGSANVVRQLDNLELANAAKMIAARLGMSGFFGLDFIIDQSGVPYLIEMNPRCTQLGHLQFPDRGDLAGALCEQITGHRQPAPDVPIRTDLIAFFPQAWISSTRGDNWYSSFQDIPWEEKSLMKYLMHEPWPKRRWQVRVYRVFRKPKPQT
jgi:hypothetical protein